MKLGKEECYRILRSVLTAEHFVGEFLSHDEFMATKVKEMHLDEPPLTDEPNYEKRSLTMKVKAAFRAKGIRLLIADDVFSEGNDTLEDLVNFFSRKNKQEKI